MWKKHLNGLAAVVVITALATACDTTTGPGLDDEELPAEATLADYEALEAVLGSSEFQAFRHLGAASPFSEAAGTAALGAGSGNGAPIISELHRGATFVYDPDSGRYEVDPERDGAPETGVRFIVYELDGAGDPILAEEIGHADLIDDGDGSAEDIVLRLVVVRHGETALDYRTTLVETDGAGTLTLNGFLRGDGTRLDYDIEATGGEGNQVDIVFDLGVPQRDFSVVGTVRALDDGSDDDGEIDVTVRHGAESIRVEAAADEGTMDGTVFLNGSVFATISGSTDSPVFRDAGGDPLTALEFLVLRTILDGVEDVFDFLEDLLDPIDGLVVLGVIL